MNVHTRVAEELWKDEGEKRELSFKVGKMKFDIYKYAMDAVKIAIDIDGKREYRVVTVTPTKVSVENL